MLASLTSMGQDGALDPSFRSPLFRVPVPLVAVEADGHVLCAVPDNTARYQLVRLNSDGTEAAPLAAGDGAESISPPISGGGMTLPGATNPATLLVIHPLPSGQFLVGGAFTHYHKVPRRLLARLNADGTVDPSFNRDDGFQGDNVSRVVPAEGGKFYVGGKFTRFGNSSRNVGLVRLNADGSLDSSFVDSTISFGANVADFSLQPDGRLLIDAAYANASFQAALQVYRVSAGGGLDASFSQGTGTSPTPAALRHALMSNGQILVSGGNGVYNGVAVNKVLFRLNNNGTVDGGYPGVELKLVNTAGLVGRFLPGPNGTIYFNGAFDKVNGQARQGLARLLADGTLDPAFVPGAAVSAAPGAWALQPDGKIIAGATTIAGREVRYNIVRLNGSGGTVPAPSPQLRSLTLLPGGTLRVEVTGAGTTSVAVEGSGDLGSWQRLASGPLVNGSFTFQDAQPQTVQSRFYRVLLGP